MLDRRFRPLPALVLAAGFATSVASTPAHAVATFTADIFASSFIFDLVDLTGPTSIKPPGSPPPLPDPADFAAGGGTAVDPFSDSFGTSSASAGGAGFTVIEHGADVPHSAFPALPSTPLLHYGDGTTQSAFAAGDATDGVAFADTLTDGVYAFTNSFGFDVEVVLDVFYTAGVSVSTDSPDELAEAAASYVIGIADVSVPDSIIIVSELLSDEIFVASDFGPTTLGMASPVGAKVAFTVTSGSTVHIATFADVYGVAVTVPEPGTWLLLAPLAAVVARRRAVAG